MESVFDLVNSKSSYPETIPVLVQLLPRINDKWLKEGIVRALTIKKARGKADLALLKEFLALPPEDSTQQILKWAIGNALSTVASDAVADALVTLAQDVCHGKAREMIVVALGGFPASKSLSVLINLLQDEIVCGHAIIAIRKLGIREAIPHIEPFTSHPKAWIRREGQKSLAKLRKANPKKEKGAKLMGFGETVGVYHRNLAGSRSGKKQI